jgi:serine/threonine protein kinase
MPVQKFDMILPYNAYDKADIRQASDLLSEMLKWAPKERIDCKEALKHPFFKGVKE